MVQRLVYSECTPVILAAEEERERVRLVVVGGGLLTIQK
jgi:hypothetical protein